MRLGLMCKNYRSSAVKPHLHVTALEIAKHVMSIQKDGNKSGRGRFGLQLKSQLIVLKLSLG